MDFEAVVIGGGHAGIEAAAALASLGHKTILITQNLKEMQQIMSNYVGIVRTDLRLNRALVRLEIIYRETEALYRKSTLSKSLCELRNLITAGYLTIKMAQDRKESRGLHYNLDYPHRKDVKSVY